MIVTVTLILPIYSASVLQLLVLLGLPVGLLVQQQGIFRR